MIVPVLVFIPLLFAFILNRHDSGLFEQTTLNEQARVLLLTAHPDDEAMFFAPTLLSLTQQSKALERSGRLAQPAVYSLCLSTGNADGLGAVRVDELKSSLDILGIPEGRRWIVDSPKLRDDMNVFWDAEAIAETVKPYISEYNITHVMTFDGLGISRHPNHISLPLGILHLLDSIHPTHPKPKLHTLVTVSLPTKYSGYWRALVAKSNIVVSRLVPRLTGLVKAETRTSVVVVSGVPQYQQALKAMLAHWSQMVWFRWLYIMFSSYMWVNEWIEVGVITTSPDGL